MTDDNTDDEDIIDDIDNGNDEEASGQYDDGYTSTEETKNSTPYHRQKTTTHFPIDNGKNSTTNYDNDRNSRNSSNSNNAIQRYSVNVISQTISSILINILFIFLIDIQMGNL